MARRRPPPDGKAPRRRHLFQKGEANPGHRSQRPKTGAGRKKGTPNKITEDIRRHIINALNDSRVGGEEWFIELANRDPRTLGSLVKAIIPQKIQTIDPEETARKIRTNLSQMDDLTGGGSEDDDS